MQLYNELVTDSVQAHIYNFLLILESALQKLL